MNWRSTASLLVLAVSGCSLLTQPVRPAPKTGPWVTVDADTLSAHVYAIAKPRDIDDLTALDATAAYLREQLTQMGYTPDDQPYEHQGRTYRNVSIVIGDRHAPRVVVGAHYDSCEPLPGADDNASGVAVLLELARLFRKTGAPAGALELVWWTLEEPPAFRKPHMGSAVHARKLVESNVAVKAALAIETVGYYRDEEGSQHFPIAFLGKLYPTRGNYIALVSNLNNTHLVRAVKAAMLGANRLPVYSINAPGLVPGIDWSDHRSYWPYGVPALMVTDTAPNRNPNYHEPTDTPDTLNYPMMARLTEALFEAVWALTRDELWSTSTHGPLQ